MIRDPEIDDVAAIHRTLSGETEAFRVVMERYGDRILRFCRSRLGSDEEAADAAQEVFLRAFRSLKSFRLGESFPAWLFGIAANRVKTKAQTRSFDKAKTERAFAEKAAEPENDPSDEVLRGIESEAIRSAVAALPIEQRTPVELYYFAELSIADTARLLGLGEEAVKTRLFRARKNLRSALEGPQRKGLRKGTLP